MVNTIMFSSVSNYVLVSKNPQDVFFIGYEKNTLYIVWTFKHTSELTLLNTDTSQFYFFTTDKTSMHYVLKLENILWITPCFHHIKDGYYINSSMYDKNIYLNENASYFYAYNMDEMKQVYTTYKNIMNNPSLKIRDEEMPPWSIFIPTFNSSFDKLYPGIENKSLIEKYVWRIADSNHPLKWTQYLHHKYRSNIQMLEYDSFVYRPEHTLALLFIDDRYDPLFPLLLRVFLYSLPNSEWNFHIFCMEKDKDDYEKACRECNVQGTLFHILNEPLRNQHGYSTLLTKYTFWSQIKEDYVLLFQYDSFVFSKMDSSFLDTLKKELFVGALWIMPIHHRNSLLWIGNGGTSFRNTRAMEIICRKYSNLSIEPEDVFFSKRLYDLRHKECPRSIAEIFSIENIYNDYSIYGHQVYLKVPYQDVEKIWTKRLFGIQ